MLRAEFIHCPSAVPDWFVLLLLGVCVANSYSGGDGQLIQPAAVGLPIIVGEADHAVIGTSGFGGGGDALQRRVRPLVIVVVPELQQLP